MSDRVQRAREEIGRRRALAQAATGEVWKLWGMEVRADLDGTSNLDTSAPVCVTWSTNAEGRLRTYDADHIAANDPAHVLAVLDAAESVLDRHAPSPGIPRRPQGACICGQFVPWPCPDALVVLNLYAPEATQ